MLMKMGAGGKKERNCLWDLSLLSARTERNLPESLSPQGTDSTIMSLIYVRDPLVMKSQK